jgi:L-lactate permease
VGVGTAPLTLATLFYWMRLDLADADRLSDDTRSSVRGIVHRAAVAITMAILSDTILTAILSLVVDHEVPSLVSAVIVFSLTITATGRWSGREFIPGCPEE